MNTRAAIHCIVSLVVFLLAAGAYAFFQYHVMQEARRSADLAHKIDATVKSAVRAAETSDTLEALAADEAAIQSYYVTPDQIVPFLERIEETGRSIGSAVEVTSVSDKPGSDGRITLSLRIIGSFDAVLRTLGAIEYGPYDSRIASLTFDTPATGGSAWTAIANFSVAVDVPQPPSKDKK